MLCGRAPGAEPATENNAGWKFPFSQNLSRGAARVRGWCLRGVVCRDSVPRWDCPWFLALRRPATM